MRYKLFFSLCLLFNGLLLSAQFHVEKLDSLFTENSKQNTFSGMVLIARDGKPVFEKSYGYADYKNNKPFQTNTTFQIASVSKQFTAFGIMLLQAKNKLKYDDKAAKYLPGFPYDNITIRQMLHHTSGLPEFWEKIRPKLNHSIANGNKELLQYLIVNKPPLEFEPGTSWMYADIGYDLLAMIIENVSGQSYEKFMKRNIFRPAGLKNTHALMVTDIRKINNKTLAYGHTWSDSLKKFEYAHLKEANDFVFYLGNFYGDGSVISSARDLLKWDEILNTNKLLANGYMQQAYVPARNNNDSVIIVNKNNQLKPVYGFGWSMVQHPVLGRMYYHNGGHPGFTTYYLRCPDKKLTVIFLCNLESSAAVSAVRTKMMEIITQGYSNN
ncbi:MAG: beta-lactamase family protein [Chitinophagaceae bacterium]|nr:beta-lactamase family protein [Chitinophagaceae bacterium]